MRALSLDTTTRVSSTALVEDGTVVAEIVGVGSLAHAERMPGDVLSVLEKARVPLSDVDVFAVVSGPGSFTGLRIGIATIQGLAFVTGRRIVPVSTLEALAHAGSVDLPEGALVAAWLDARRRDVFSALYRVTAAPAFHRDRLLEIDPPVVGQPGGILARWTGQGTPDVFVGDGAAAFASLLDPRARVVVPPSLAGVIGRLAISRAAVGESVDPAGVQPLYVRRPDAEVARDDRKAQSARPPISS